MISTHFKGTEVYLVVGNHEFQIKVSPRLLNQEQDAARITAELLYEKLMEEIEETTHQAIKAGLTVGRIQGEANHCKICGVPQQDCQDSHEFCCADCTHIYE